MSEAASSRASVGGWAVKALWLVGLAVSAYLTFEHYTASTTLVCADTGVINCANVTTSKWSYLFGIPVALLGLLYNVGGTLFAFVIAPRRPAGRVRVAGTLYTGAGLLFVLYLVWAELVMIGQICSWCTVVHVVTAVLFMIYLASWIVDRDRA